MKCCVCQKRETDRPQVCDGCRRRVAEELRALPDAYAMLVVVEDLDGGKDPVSQTLPAGTVRSGVRDAPVTGSREAPVPVNLDLVDLTAESRSGTVQDTQVPMVETRKVDVRVHRVDHITVVREEVNAAGEVVERRERVPVTVDQVEQRTERIPVHGGFGELLWVDAGDQIGELPVASELDRWVRDWISTRDRSEHLPVPTVVTLAGWLYDRLDWALDEHPAVDEFAEDIRRLLRTCQRISGDRPVRPTVLVGVPCATPECDGLLVHDAESKYRAECGSCGRLWTDEEYAEWTQIVKANPVHTAAFIEATEAWLDRRSAR